MGHQDYPLTVLDARVIREALLLRSAQLRRAINAETDASILRIRQEQFRHVDNLVNTFRTAQIED